jgi:hypothetical protein
LGNQHKLYLSTRNHILRFIYKQFFSSWSDEKFPKIIKKNIQTDIINIKKMFKPLIHLADSQTLLEEARETGGREKKMRANPKFQPSLPKAFADMKRANCSTIH